MATERIDLGDLGEGQWWDVRTTLTRAMEKAVTRASLAAMPQLEPGANVTEETVKASLYSHIGAVDIGAIEDAYLMHGTVAYSFGPQVTMQVIDQLDAAIVRRVITRMFELYSPQRITPEQQDGLFKTPLNAS